MKAKNTTKDSLINQMRDRYESPFGFLDPVKKSEVTGSNQGSPSKDKLTSENLKKLEAKSISGNQIGNKPNLPNNSSKLDPVAYVLSSNQARLKNGITRLDKEKVNGQSSSPAKLHQSTLELSAQDLSPLKSYENSPKKPSNLQASAQTNFESPEKLSKSINVAYLTSNDSIIPGKVSMPNTLSHVNLSKKDALDIELTKKSHTAITTLQRNDVSPAEHHSSMTSSMYKNIDLVKSGLNNTGISNLRPTDAKLLKSYGVQPVEAASPGRHVRSNEEDEDCSSPLGKVREVELEELEKYRRSKDYKSVEREKNLDKNIWRRIDEFNQQKSDKEHKNKVEKKKHVQDEWLTTLQQQVLQKQAKKQEAKELETEHYKQRVALDLKLQLEDEQRRQAHKDFIRDVEKKNYYEISKEKEVLKKSQDLDKEREIQRVNENLDDYVNQKNRVKEDRAKAKKELNKIMTDNIESRAHKKVNDKSEENNKNIQIIQGLVDRKMKEEEEYYQFREWLRDKSRKMRDPDVKTDKNVDNLRKYGEPNKGAQPQEGMMKFLYSEKYDETATADNRKEQRTVLNNVYEVQKREALEKNQFYKDYINEQNALWKEEEYQMNLREDLTLQAAKLKKQIQKDDLDAQKEIDSKIKHGNVGPHDIWVNRKTLKELKSVPQEYSRKIAYMRS